MAQRLNLKKLAIVILLGLLTVLPNSYAGVYDLSIDSAQNVKANLQDLAQLEFGIFVAQALTFDLIDRLNFHRSSHIDVQDSLFRAPTKNPNHTHLNLGEVKKFMNRSDVNPKAKEHMQTYLTARAQLRHQVIQSTLQLAMSLNERMNFDNQQSLLQRLGNIEFIRGLEGENNLVEMIIEIRTTLNGLRMNALELPDGEIKTKWLRLIDSADAITTMPDRFEVREAVLKFGQLIQEILTTIDNGSDPRNIIVEARQLLVRTMDWTHNPSETTNQFSFAYNELVQALAPNCASFLQEKSEAQQPRSETNHPNK